MSALVIGVGNRFRRDDAAGLVAAELVRDETTDDVHVVTFEGDLTSLVDVWDGSSRVFVVDAVRSGGRPGTVYRFDAGRDPAPAPFHGRGTHTLSIAEVVELARAVHRLPDALVTYGIEAEAFDPGEGVSAEVEAGAHEAADRLLAELGEGGR